MDVDALAQEIRRVDGDHEHRLGAGALAEALMPFLAALAPPVEADAEAVAWAGADELAYLARNPMSNAVVWGAERGKESRVPLFTHPPLAAQPPDDVREALTVGMEWFQNVDAWGAAEWFDRLAKAIRAQDAAVVAGNDMEFETCRNVASSSAMRLVRDYEQVVRAALASPTPPDDVAEGMVALRKPTEAMTGAEYEEVHRVAIDAYEAATPPSYRYSATALRKAVDAALAAAPAHTQGVRDAVLEEAAKVVRDKLDAIALYHEDAANRKAKHFDREDAARSYRATAKEIDRALCALKSGSRQ